MKNAVIALICVMFLAGCTQEVPSKPRDENRPAKEIVSSEKATPKKKSLHVSIGVAEVLTRDNGDGLGCFVPPAVGDFASFSEKQMKLLDDTGRIVAVADSGKGEINEHGTCQKDVYFDFEMEDGHSLYSLEIGTMKSDVYTLDEAEAQTIEWPWN